MRLLLVVPRLVSYRAFFRELALSLLAEGHEVHLALSPVKLWAGEEAEDDGVRKHYIDFPRGMNPLAHWRAARALDALVRTVEPDAVHAHFSAAIFTTALAIRDDWPETLATFHGVSFLAMSGWKARLMRATEGWAASRYDRVWVLTEDDRAGLQRAVPSARVERLPGFGVGCDVDVFRPPTTAERSARRAELGFKAEHLVFAFVGRFVAFKGFATAVRAFLALAKERPEARLLLIGAADRLHGSGLSADEEAALSASNQIVDLGYREDVARCLSAADLFVFPSRREGLPVSLMEALAMGLPAITLDSRGCREVVRDGVDGFVLREDSVESLRAKMEQLAASLELRERLATAALARRDRFSRDEFVRTQKGLYLELTNPAEEGQWATA